MASLNIVPCLWFDTQAEDAATLYTSVFPNSRIVEITRFPAAGQEVHGKPAGSVMTVEFELDGQPFTALNGGPDFTFNEAVSFQILCSSQQEVDYYWERLTADGGRESVCGWLADPFGLSWQVVPIALNDMMRDRDERRRERVMKAMLTMKKIDIAALERARDG